MRKILILLISFICIQSIVNAGSLNESYIEKSQGIICVDTSFIKDLFDVNGDQTALTNYYNAMTDTVKERSGIDLENEVEQAGFFLMLKENQIKPIGFISGKFNLNHILPTIKRNIASEPELLEEIQFKDFKANVFQLDELKIVFQNNNLIWFCDEYELENYINNPISFSKAPDYIKNLSDQSNSFLCIGRELWEKFFGFNQKKLMIDLDSVTSISAYMKDWNIYIEANLDSQKSAEVLKLQLEYWFKNYNEIKEDLTVDESFTNFFKQINALYLSARIKDIIKSLKLEVKEKRLVILFPYDKTNFNNALSDFIMNIIKPSYEKAKEEKKVQTCYHTQHLITKAVEKFNNENEPMMSHYDRLTLSVEGYLPYSYDFGSDLLKKSECEYTSVGSLDNDGYIICKKHGPAVPLIKPQISEERYLQEDQMLTCFSNMKRINDAVYAYNSKIRYEQRNNKSGNSEEKPLMLDKLDLNLLNQYITEEEDDDEDEDSKRYSYGNYYENEINKLKDIKEIVGCEYYIKGNLDTNGHIACKRHGVLSSGHLYNLAFDYETRQPRKIIEKIKKEKEKEKQINNPTKEVLKKCFNNIQKITYALELYNMDNAVMMEKELNLSKLVEGKYLENPIDKPTPECEYYIEGNILKDGKILCKRHGSFSNFVEY